MVLFSLLVCGGQLLWQLGVTNESLIMLLGGFILYGLGAVTMIIAYRFGSLSVLQPILSVSYILSLGVGHYVLNEQISWINIIGVTIIVMGIMFIIAGDKK